MAGNERQTMYAQNGTGSSSIPSSPASTDFEPHSLLLTLKCGNHEWRLHPDLLIAASPALAIACFRGDTVGEGEIPGAIGALLQCLHTGDYDDEEFDLDEWPEDFEMSSLSMNVYVYILACKYGISALATLAKTKFEKLAATEYWRKSFADAVKEAYTRDTHHTREIKESIVKICCRTGVALLVALGPTGLTGEQLGVCGSLCEVARKIPSFKQDLAAALVMHAECALPAKFEFERPSEAEEELARMRRLGLAVEPSPELQQRKR